MGIIVAPMTNVIWHISTIYNEYIAVLDISTWSMNILILKFLVNVIYLNLIIKYNIEIS